MLAQTKTAALTSSALAILERLHREDANRLAKINAEAKHLRDLYARRTNLQADLADLNAKYPPKRRKDDEGPSSSDLKRKALEDEIDRVSRNIAALEKARDNRPPVMGGAMVDAKLRKLRAGVFIADDPAEFKLRKGETHRAALDRIDSAIDEAEVERKRIAAAPRTGGEMRAESSATIDALAARGGPRVAALRNDGNLELPQFRLPVTQSHRFQFGPDGVAMLCWLFPDLVKERLSKIIEAFDGDESAMTREAQAAALEECDAAIFQLQHERGAIVEAIVADGGEATHRADAPLEAVLQISID